jgi:hypothetical protein
MARRWSYPAARSFGRHLGDEFIAEVSAAFERIGAAPESYAAWPGTWVAETMIRKTTVQYFP